MSSRDSDRHRQVVGPRRVKGRDHERRFVRGEGKKRRRRRKRVGDRPVLKRLLEPDEVGKRLRMREDRPPDPLTLEHASQPVEKLPHSSDP
jgi:hypothetical protein